MSNFEMRDLLPNACKEITLCFLGLNIIKTKTTLFANQKDLICKVLCKFGMNECKSLSTPIQRNLNLRVTDVCDENLPYRQLVGHLMYIMLGSRPDLCFAITYFSQFQNNFNREHWVYLKNVLKYLKSTENYALKFEKSTDKTTNSVFSAFVDADFASDITDRKSISGYCIKMFGNIIFWKSKKQVTVALSSCEAEYVALANCVMECNFLSQLLNEISNYSIYPINIYEDNQSCIKMAETLETKRTKHIDVKHHYIRDCIDKNKIVLNYIPTNEQEADIFTKGLPTVKFKYFRDKLKILNV
uniref:Reverse transcriptase Ty1/copia-type domain-containing protein n=1 Tax=Photinus pyralis TaxID=7054 RepID=A0A1Y1M7S3_PHOPY